jgi:hypothetical protein
MLDWIQHNYDMLIKLGILVSESYSNNHPTEMVYKEYNALKQRLVEESSSMLEAYAVENSEEGDLEHPPISMAYFNYKVELKKAERLNSWSITQNYTLKIAKMYANVGPIYFPVFLDFRGRIYRPGLLNIQASSLARSLLMWAQSPESYEVLLKPHSSFFNQLFLNYYYNVAQSCKRFSSYDDAVVWAKQRFVDGSIFHYFDSGVELEDPLQFASLVLVKYPSDLTYTDGVATLTREHVNLVQRRDATSSVFQILSYMTANKELATMTNVLSATPKPATSSHIQDIYSTVRQAFLNHVNDLLITGNYKDLHFKKDPTKPIFSLQSFTILVQDILPKFLTRSFVKSVIMPLSYGIYYIRICDLVREHALDCKILMSEDLERALPLLFYRFVLDYFKKRGPYKKDFS